MHQKRKIVAWMLIALFSVFVGISLFAISPVLARATDTTANPVVIPIPTQNTVWLGIWRPDGSTVGSVQITTNSGILDQCVNLPQQDVVYGFGNINGQDTITIAHYPGADCQGTDGVNRESSKTYTGQVNSLAPGSPDGSYRVYQTPKDA